MAFTKGITMLTINELHDEIDEAVKNASSSPLGYSTKIHIETLEKWRTTVARICHLIVWNKEGKQP